MMLESCALRLRPSFTLPLPRKMVNAKVPVRRRQPLTELMTVSPTAASSLSTTTAMVERSSERNLSSAACFKRQSFGAEGTSAFFVLGEDQPIGQSRSLPLHQTSSREEQEACATKLRNVIAEQGTPRIRCVASSSQGASRTSGPQRRRSNAPVKVDVSLVHPSILRQMHLHASLAAREVAMTAFRLQTTASRNELSRVTQKMPFRCLRCFHVFPARPSAVVPSPIGAATKRAGEVGRARSPLSFRQRNRTPQPSHKGMLGSVAQRARAQHDGWRDACPHCGSTSVQWGIEYIHHRTHASLSST